MLKKIFIKYIKNYCYYIETFSHVLIFNYTDGKLPNFSRKRNKEIFFIVTSSELEYFSEKIFQYKNIKNYHYILPEDMDNKYKAFLKNSGKIVKPFNSFNESRFIKNIYLNEKVRFYKNVETIKINDLIFSFYKKYDFGSSVSISFKNLNYLSIFYCGKIIDEDNKNELKYFTEMDKILNYNYAMNMDICFIPFNLKKKKQPKFRVSDFVRFFKPSFVFPMIYGNKLTPIQNFVFENNFPDTVVKLIEDFGDYQEIKISYERE